MHDSAQKDYENEGRCHGEPEGWMSEERNRWKVPFDVLEAIQKLEWVLVGDTSEMMPYDRDVPRLKTMLPKKEILGIFYGQNIATGHLVSCTVSSPLPSTLTLTLGCSASTRTRDNI